jgi:hypothetical protein
MRQIAWLAFYGGLWHLATPHNDHRKWTSREAALPDLKAEGRIFDSPHGKPPTIRHDSNRHFCGYELRRTVH